METENNYIETDLGNVAPNPRGEYSETATYEYLDLVEYGGGSYLCIQETGTVTGTAPVMGRNTDAWQILTLPGDLTPEYIAMHDDVVDKTESVQADAASTAADREQVESMLENVEQLHAQTETAAQEASDSRDSAAGYAVAAEASRTAAAESEKNTQLQVTGFDETVNTAKQDATEEITTARKTAVQAVAAQQVKSVNAVNAAGSAAIEKTSADAKEAKDAKAAAVSAANAAEGSAREATTAAGRAKNDKQSAETAAVAAKSSATEAETAKIDAEAAAANAENSAATAEAAQKAVEKAAEDVKKEKAQALKEIKDEADAQVERIRNTPQNERALFLLNLHKDGKKYGVHFDNYDVTPASTGTRLYDAVGMTAAPSTNTVRAKNDFDGRGCFAYLEVNGSVDENGDFQVKYIKDIDNEFSRAKYDTWCLYLTQYVYRKFDANGEDTVISDTRHSEEWLPEGCAIRPDGTIRPFVAIAKYMSGDNAEGVASSISGVSPKNYSFQSSLTKFRAKGTQYCAETSQDSERMTRLMEIAFATRHSQSVMAGCTSYYLQYAATVQETDVERIIISKSNAKNLIVGSTVSIGNANALTSDGNPNMDRGQSGIHAKANRVQITKIEDYDDNNSAVYVDNGGQKFSTAPTSVSGVTCNTYISTMPWRTGGCDNVLGSCGSPTSNTNNKEPYILFGVEMSSGFWEVKGNTVMKIENHVMRPYICYDCTKMTTAGATTDDWIALGYGIPDNRGQWKYISKLGYTADDPEVRYPEKADATSSTGYADGCYTENLEAAGDGQREVLGSGSLIGGALDGRRGAYLNLGLGTGWWVYAARLSACGRCGRKAAA